MQAELIGERAQDRAGEDRGSLGAISQLLNSGPRSQAQLRLNASLNQRGGLAQLVIQREGEEDAKAVAEARESAAGGNYTEALQKICGHFGLDACATLPTDDYAAVLPEGATVPAGVPFGLTVDGPIVYIHQDWIKRWLVDTDQPGNLINTIKHEQQHARQRLDSGFLFPGNNDVMEFEAYAHEILSTDKLLSRASNTAASSSASSSSGGTRPELLPTEPSLRLAMEAATEHYSRMGEKEQGSYAAQFAEIQAAWERLKPVLTANDHDRDSTRLAESEFVAKLEEMRACCEGLAPPELTRGEREQRALSCLKIWKQAESRYQEITAGRLGAYKKQHEDLDALNEICMEVIRSRGLLSKAGREAVAASSSLSLLPPPPGSSPAEADDDFGDFQSANFES
jgi:hypothetical protein